MNHPLPDAAANSYSWRQSYSNKVAAVTLQSTCTLPQWREPTALNGSELTPREKPAAAFQFRGAGHTGLLHGVLRQPGMCRWQKIMKGKALGPKDWSGDCTGVEWPGQQAGIGKGANREWPIWSSILSSPNDHIMCLPILGRHKTLPTQNTLRMRWTHFILQLSGQHGHSSVCKSSHKVSAAALGLVFSMMSKQSKNKKQITRPEYDETEEWKSWLKHFPNATLRNRWRKKWNDSSLLLSTYCITQH